jgi:hypothetical protein
MAAIAGHKRILKFLARQPHAVLNLKADIGKGGETSVNILTDRHSDLHPRACRLTGSNLCRVW